MVTETKVRLRQERDEEARRILEEERRSIREEVSLTKLLILNGVLGMDGTVYRPTKAAMLELLKWHAGGGSILAVPMSKLALELSCCVSVVRRLIEGLEADGLICRFKGCAPGRLYTIEIVGPVPEPDDRPLRPLEEALLEVLVRRKNDEGIVQTNEHELALELDVSHETVLLNLISLRRRGYVSSASALYGRPLIIKVQHDRPVRNGHPVQAKAFCVKCRGKQPVREVRFEQTGGAKGARVRVAGKCAVCGTSVTSWVPSSLLGARDGGTGNDSKEKLERFLEWREETRKQEEEQLRTLMRELGMEVARV